METPTQHRRFPILAFVAAAALSVALPGALQAQEAVAAQQPAAAPAPQVVRQIPEEKLAAYAAAYAEIADVRERINAEFARTGNKIREAQEELQKQRQEEVKKIIEAKGLTADEYEQITWVLSVDAKQMEAFTQLVARQRAGGSEPQ